MKLFKTTFYTGGIIIIFIIISIAFGDNLRYKRIGNTNFYLMETYAISKEGFPLASLFYKHDSTEIYEGVCMSGYPLYIMWNSDFIITKNYDGNHRKIINYNIIEIIHSNVSQNSFKVYEFSTKSRYHIALSNYGIDEQNLEHTDNNISWSFHFFR